MLNLLNFYRYFRNHLSIRISDGFVERFLNLCNINKINLWNINLKGNAITANLYCKDFPDIRKIAKKSGVKIKIESKNGLNFDIRKHKKYKTLLLSLFFFIVLMFLMNMFVWEIQVEGADVHSIEKILSISEEVGLKYGTFVPTFDKEKAARNVLNQLNEEVIWIAINIKGSKATIEIRELTKHTDNKQNNEPSNLVADFDGILIDTKTVSGVQCAYAGESVYENQLLVSGIYESEDGTLMYQNSAGTFTALHTKKISKKYDTFSYFEQYSTAEGYAGANVFGIDIPLSHKIFTNNITYSYKNTLSFTDKQLPISIYKYFSSTTTALEKIKLNILYCIDKFTADEYEAMKKTLITSTKYKLKHIENHFLIECDYNCIDYIGKKVPIFFL